MAEFAQFRLRPRCLEQQIWSGVRAVDELLNSSPSYMRAGRGAGGVACCRACGYMESSIGPVGPSSRWAIAETGTGVSGILESDTQRPRDQARANHELVEFLDRRPKSFTRKCAMPA